ncbi:MAG: hypothetical protein JSS32_02450 [Verrucomicrobia bacterium]|nr:hypothetical protein [Verrucomicrobiota bacterium]
MTILPILSPLIKSYRIDMIGCAGMISKMVLYVGAAVLPSGLSLVAAPIILFYLAHPAGAADHAYPVTFYEW